MSALNDASQPWTPWIDHGDWTNLVLLEYPFNVTKCPKLLWSEIATGQCLVQVNMKSEDTDLMCSLGFELGGQFVLLAS